jgi:branched-chain amino acid transport system ATP-binding protein
MIPKSGNRFSEKIMRQQKDSPLLSVRNLEVRYGDLVGLADVSLEVAQGSVVALLGSNGAGKTTTLNAIAGLVRASRGHIAWMGGEISQLPAYAVVARGLTLSPEGWRLFTQQTVEQNLRLGATPLADKTRVPAQLERVFALFPRLAERRRQRAGTLSGGERQMLALGRALMSAPRLLMLDEPSLGLAPLIVRDILRIVVSLREAGVSILLVEQNARAALEIADHGYVLETGEIVLSGEAKSLLGSARVQASYLGKGN